MSADRQLAVVTGASSGIGAEFARQLAARGFDLVVTARRRDRLEQLATELATAYGCQVSIVVADLALPTSIATIMAMVADRPVDVLVNNAGSTVAGRFAETDWAVQRDCLATLVTAVAALTHAIVPAMVARGRGRIITISSILALSQGGRGHTLYPAAKAFAHKFMLSLDAEVRAYGVICTSVLPGSTASEFRDANKIAAAGSARFVSSAASVVRAALRANDQGRLIVIPGLHNRIAAIAMKILPDALVRFAGKQLT
ncbi:MAG: SDR family NAD(P)-dependent oxidoreductase [Sphingomonas sp.]